MLTEWVYAARNTEGWLEKHNLAVALLIIEELRNHYWAAAGVAVERVQQRLHRDDDPQDRYGQLVVDEQLRGRTAQRAPRRRSQGPFCFGCHQPGHLRSNCPQTSQQQGGSSVPHAPRNRIFEAGWWAAPTVTAHRGLSTRKCSPPQLLLVPVVPGDDGWNLLPPFPPRSSADEKDGHACVAILLLRVSSPRYVSVVAVSPSRLALYPGSPFPPQPPQPPPPQPPPPLYGRPGSAAKNYWGPFSRCTPKIPAPLR